MLNLEFLLIFGIIHLKFVYAYQKYMKEYYLTYSVVLDHLLTKLFPCKKRQN